MHVLLQTYIEGIHAAMAKPRFRIGNVKIPLIIPRSRVQSNDSTYCCYYYPETRVSRFHSTSYIIVSCIIVCNTEQSLAHFLGYR